MSIFDWLRRKTTAPDKINDELVTNFSVRSTYKTKGMPKEQLEQLRRLVYLKHCVDLRTRLTQEILDGYEQYEKDYPKPSSPHWDGKLWYPLK